MINYLSLKLVLSPENNEEYLGCAFVFLFDLEKSNNHIECMQDKE